MQLEVSAEWEEMKKLKDSDLEVAVNKKISELKKLSTKKKAQSMAIGSKFVSGKANKKHSGCSSQDVDVEEAAVIPVIPAPAENSSQSSSSSPDPPAESLQAALLLYYYYFFISLRLKTYIKTIPMYKFTI